MWAPLRRRWQLLLRHGCVQGVNLQRGEYSMSAATAAASDRREETHLQIRPLPEFASSLLACTLPYPGFSKQCRQCEQQDNWCHEHNQWYSWRSWQDAQQSKGQRAVLSSQGLLQQWFKQSCHYIDWEEQFFMHLISTSQTFMSIEEGQGGKEKKGGGGRGEKGRWEKEKGGRKRGREAAAWDEPLASLWKTLLQTYSTDIKSLWEIAYKNV